MFNLFSKEEEKEPEDLSEVLSRFKDLKKDFKDLSERFEKMEGESKLNVKKVGMVRYNPFKEVGGDQSFSLALLDEENTGVVITSLYSREGNRIYGKPIEKGESKYTLSKEEERAIESAKNRSITADK